MPVRTTHAAATSSSARLRGHDSDLVALELIRLASQDAWSRDDAARALLAKHPTRTALRRVQGWVAHARAKSTSKIADRAAATLTATLAMLDHSAGDRPGRRENPLAPRAERRSDELARADA